MAMVKLPLATNYFDWDTYKIRITFLQEMLGSNPKDENLFASYVAKKAPTAEDAEEEMDLLRQNLAKLSEAEKIELRGTTGFLMREGTPVIKNYVIKGFLKAALMALNRTSLDLAGNNVHAFRKVVDQVVLVEPTWLTIILPEGEKMGICERPLRAQTPQGERVALARSETCPAGSYIDFTLKVLPGDFTQTALEEVLIYGSVNGLGAWRNAGNGAFQVEYEAVGDIKSKRKAKAKKGKKVVEVADEE
jgi:hypothetical protein